MRLSIDSNAHASIIGDTSPLFDDDGAEIQVGNAVKPTEKSSSGSSDTDSSSDATHLDPDYVAKDKEAKKKLVVETIASHAPDLSLSHPVFAEILRAQENGDEVCATVISGGYTNYSYKIYLKDRPDVALFAKLAFDYALWNPDPDAVHDLIRTENEYTIMKKVSTLVDDAPVATPYLCTDVQQVDGATGRSSNMKLLCTEWSNADEQLANQWIDGKVDRRVLKKLAQTLAEVNCCEDMADNFNSNIRDCFDSVYSALIEVVDKLDTSTDDTDRAANLLKSLGKDYCLKLVDRCQDDWYRPQALIHSDAHAFNTLVEKKPDDTAESSFGSGDCCLCDWEMSYIGPIGRDVGLAWSWPISCLLAHAVMGNSEKVDIVEPIKYIWNEYEKVLRSKGKDDAFLQQTYRNCIAWAGWFVLYVHYHHGAQTEFLPIDDTLSEAERTELSNSIGVASLKLFHIGFSSDAEHTEMSLSELQQQFESILLEEVTLLSNLKKRRPRRMKQMSHLTSSMLRRSGRRVSDAMLYAGLTPNVLKEIKGDL